MALIDQFNNTFQRVPSISRDLENSIIEHQWPNRRAKLAVKIIRQLSKDRLILKQNGLTLLPLIIVVSPVECDINATTFNSENILQAEKYIKDLLVCINIISPAIKFFLEKYENNITTCVFYISWKF